MKAKDRSFDPYGVYNFVIDDISTGKFASVEGLSFETEAIEYRVSDKPKLPLYRQGMSKNGRVTLKRGMLMNNDLLAWLKEGESGRVSRKNATIWVRDNAHENAKGWNLFGCMPVKWSISSLDGNQSAIIVESLEMVVEKIDSVTA